MPVSPAEHVGRVLTPAAIAFVEELTCLFRPRIEAQFLTLPAYDILTEAS
jgi:hypothetical protein